MKVVLGNDCPTLAIRFFINDNANYGVRIGGKVSQLGPNFTDKPRETDSESRFDPVGKVTDVPVGGSLRRLQLGTQRNVGIEPTQKRKKLPWAVGLGKLLCNFAFGKQSGYGMSAAAPVMKPACTAAPRRLIGIGCTMYGAQLPGR